MRKILFNTLLGFCVGITFLMLTYLWIYYIEGQETFNSSILKLSDISVFQKQLLIVGFIGAMFSFIFHFANEAKESITENHISPTKLTTTIALVILTFIFSTLFIKNSGIFNQVVAYALLFVQTIIIVFYGVFQCIQSAIDELIINKKIKEKNS